MLVGIGQHVDMYTRKPLLPDQDPDLGDPKGSDPDPQHREITVA